jgi:hypothetical protein
MMKAVLGLLSLLMWPFLITAQQPVRDAKILKKLSSVNYQQKADRLIANIRAKGFRLEEALPPGYVKDGSVDYSLALQKALNENKLIIFPAFPILINDGGIKLISNQQVLFEKGSELWLKPTDKKSYVMLLVKNVKDVVLVNPVIKGDRKGHTGKGGEHGMGLGIYGTDNCIVYNPVITDCWGDGIYVGLNKDNNVTSRNITVVNAYLKNNRRNNMSVTSVKGMKLIRPYFGFANGTKPEAGIDFEPNSNLDDMEEIYVVNPVTEGNLGGGLEIAVNQWHKDSINLRPEKKLTITIFNHRDIKSANATKLSYQKASFPNSKTSIKGFIKFINPTWEKGHEKMIVNFLREPTMLTSIIHPTIIIDGRKLNAVEAEATIRKDITNSRAPLELVMPL